MPVARFQLPDGRIARFEVPDGTTPEQAQSMMAAHFASAPKVAPIDVDPTKGVSGFENFAAGAGKAVADLGSGIQQIGAHVGNKVGLVSDQTVRGIDQDVTETKARDAALMNTGAGLAGNVAGNVATFVLPAAGIAKGAQVANAGRATIAARALINPATIGEGVGSGIVQGALQPVADGDSRALNAAVGGVGGGVGQGVVSTLGRAAQPIRNALSPAASKAIETLQAAGIPLDAAQRSGSALLNRVRSTLNDNPFLAGGQAKLQGRQGEAFNNAALGTIGEQAPFATKDVLQRADDRIGGVFSDILSRNNVPITDETLSKLGAIQQKANREGQGGAVGTINDLINAINADGAVPGQTAYNLRKEFVRMGKDPNTGYHSRQAGSALMDAINGGLSANDQAAFSQARSQFRNMSLLEGAISNDDLGNISANKLSNILGQKGNRSASKYGRGDQELVDLAGAGRQLLGDKLPNSGTAARLALPLTAAGGAFSADGDAGDALKIGALTYAAPRLAQQIINSPVVARYVAEGLSPSAMRALLEAPQNNALVNALLRATAVSAASSGTRQGRTGASP